jgi:UDP-glucose 4-epimerase
VADLAAAHVAALSACRGGQYSAYNLGTGQGVSINDVIGRSRAITGKAIPAEAEARRPGDPASLIADASLARKMLKWEPAYSSLDNIIDSAWRWMTEHRLRVAGSSDRAGC